MEECSSYTLELSPLYKRVAKKLKRHNHDLLQQLERGVEKILNNPTLGKPLRSQFRNYRRIHVDGSFVLLYEVQNCVVRLVDFDHHDRVYKKYS